MIFNKILMKQSLQKNVFHKNLIKFHLTKNHYKELSKNYIYFLPLKSIKKENSIWIWYLFICYVSRYKRHAFL